MRKCKDSSRQGAAQGNTGNFTAYFPLEERREEEISRHIEMLSDIDASIGQRLSDCPKLIRVELFVDEFKYLYLFCDQKKDYILMSVYSRIDFGWEKVYPN